MTTAGESFPLTRLSLLAAVTRAQHTSDSPQSVDGPLTSTSAPAMDNSSVMKMIKAGLGGGSGANSGAQINEAVQNNSPIEEPIETYKHAKPEDIFPKGIMTKVVI